MNAIVNRMKAFLVDESGPTATEYAVMLALIVVACIAAITALQGAVQGAFQGTADDINSNLS